MATVIKDKECETCGDTQGVSECQTGYIKLRGLRLLCWGCWLYSEELELGEITLKELKEAEARGERMREAGNFR